MSLPSTAGVRLKPEYTPPDLADRWFGQLKQQVTWKTETIVLFGKSRVVPRLVAWYGDAGMSYRYSGIDHPAEGWSPLLKEIRDHVAAALPVTPNFVLLNRYRGGNDSMGWHSDDEPMESPWLGSLSLGAQRRFLIRPDGIRSESLLLKHGSLLIFERHLPHALPKTRRVCGERINLSFRTLTSR